MTSFFFGKKDTPVSQQSPPSPYPYVEPDPEDYPCIREVEVQRFKWNTFLKARPNVWSEQWLWQNWKDTTSKSGRPLIKMMSMFSAKQKAHKKVKKLIRAGVPPELRGSVWWACSGAADKMKAAAAHEQYSVLVSRASELADTSIASDIEKDLLRTFPERIKADDVENIDALRRVLMAYALRNTMVGYCQSMNYICALILFHLPEEETFWLLATLLEDILPCDYYAPSLLGGRIDQQVFQSCIAWKLPQIHAAFKKSGTMLEPIICPWFLCLYINVLPLYTTCRVWDCMFWEGSVVLFRIGLALMKSKTKSLLEANDFISTYSILKTSSFNGREYSFTLESAAPASPTAQSHSNSIDSNSNTASSASDLSGISDTQFLINSAFGYRWMRSVPKAKVNVLRHKFNRLLDEDHDERISTGPTSPTSPSSSSDKGVHRTTSKQNMTTASPGRQSGKKEKKNRTRKSTYMLRLLDDNDISTLQDIAKELDEGLGSHVEEFAKELHNEADGEATPCSKDEGEDGEEDDEDEEGDILDEDEDALED